MKWTEGDKWTVEIDALPEGTEFKLVINDINTKRAEWEAGDNRLVTVADGAEQLVYGNPALTVQVDPDTVPIAPAAEEADPVISEAVALPVVARSTDAAELPEPAAVEVRPEAEVPTAEQVPAGAAPDGEALLVEDEDTTAAKMTEIPTRGEGADNLGDGPDADGNYGYDPILRALGLRSPTPAPREDVKTVPGAPGPGLELENEPEAAAEPPNPVKPRKKEESLEMSNTLDDMLEPLPESARELVDKFQRANEEEDDVTRLVGEITGAREKMKRAIGSIRPFESTLESIAMSVDDLELVDWEDAPLDSDDGREAESDGGRRTEAGEKGELKEVGEEATGEGEAGAQDRRGAGDVMAQLEEGFDLLGRPKPAPSPNTSRDRLQAAQDRLLERKREYKEQIKRKEEEERAKLLTEEQVDAIVVRERKLVEDELREQHDADLENAKKALVTEKKALEEQLRKKEQALKDALTDTGGKGKKGKKGRKQAAKGTLDADAEVKAAEEKAAALLREAEERFESRLKDEVEKAQKRAHELEKRLADTEVELKKASDGVKGNDGKKAAESRAADMKAELSALKEKESAQQKEIKEMEVIADALRKENEAAEKRCAILESQLKAAAEAALATGSEEKKATGSDAEARLKKQLRAEEQKVAELQVKVKEVRKNREQNEARVRKQVNSEADKKVQALQKELTEAKASLVKAETEAEERAAKQIKEIEAQTRKELQAEIQAADFMFRSSMLVAAMDTERQGVASDEAQRLAEKLAETNILLEEVTTRAAEDVLAAETMAIKAQDDAVQLSDKLEAATEAVRAEYEEEIAALKKALKSANASAERALEEKAELETLVQDLGKQVKSFRDAMDSMAIAVDNDEGAPVAKGRAGKKARKQGEEIAALKKALKSANASAERALEEKAELETLVQDLGKQVKSFRDAMDSTAIAVDNDVPADAESGETRFAPARDDELSKRDFRLEPQGSNRSPGSPAAANDSPNSDIVGAWRQSVVEARGVAEGLVLRMGGISLPHVDKEWRGEDSFFLSDAGAGAFGVADGVGGYTTDGVDPGRFSRLLSYNCMALLNNSGRSKGGLRDIMDAAHRDTDIAGGSTLVLGRLVQDGASKGAAVLESCTLGDCQFVVFRNGKKVFETPSQSHGFNMPYQFAQLSKYPDSDTAKSAAAMDFEVQEGDVIVAGSDGLFDNVWDYEIADEVIRWVRDGAGVAYGPEPGSQIRRVKSVAETKVGEGLKKAGTVRVASVALAEEAGKVVKAPKGPTFDLSGLHPELLAENLAKLAQNLAYDKSHVSPIRVRARDEGMLNWQTMLDPNRLGGGKMDDCTAVVAVVVRK